MRTDLYWVGQPTPGRLAIAARPRGGDWLDDEVAGWRRAGVDVIVSLLTTDEVTELDLAGEAEVCRNQGIRFESLPVPDRGVPASAPAVADLTARLVGELARGKTVVIHCRQGIGRSALLAAGVLIHSGANAADALHRIEAARGRPVPETPEQSRWVKEFAAAFAPQTAR